MKWQGKTGLIWFTGVVEDRNDPLFLNRVRVRIYGVHTHEKQLIATPDLPWSQVLMPVTSPSLSGLGTTTHGLVEGSTVMGFWRDGLTMQDPVIMGSFIGQPQKYSRKIISATGEEEIERTPSEGFNDPRLATEASYKKTPDGPGPQHMSNRSYGLTLSLDKSPRDQGSDSAINYPRESYIGTSDVNKLAQGWADKPEATTAPDNPFKLMTDDEAKLKLIDPNTGFFAYTTDTVSLATWDERYTGEDTVERTIFVSYKDEIAAEGDLLSQMGTPAEHKIPQATAAWKKIKTDNNRKVQAKANVSTDSYTDAYDYIYPNSVIENGGVGKTLFKGTAPTLDTTAGEALLTGLAGPTLNKGDDEDRRSWVKPKYPFNHVYESESGHVIEIDDTPDYERINIFHRKGARIEINNKGEIHMIAAEGQDINIQGYNINLHDYGSGTFNIHSVGKILMNALGDGIKIITEGQTTLFSKGETSVFSLLNTKIKALGKNIIG